MAKREKATNVADGKTQLLTDEQKRSLDAQVQQGTEHRASAVRNSVDNPAEKPLPPVNATGAKMYNLGETPSIGDYEVGTPTEELGKVHQQAPSKATYLKSPKQEHKPFEVGTPAQVKAETQKRQQELAEQQGTDEMPDFYGKSYDDFKSTQNEDEFHERHKQDFMTDDERKAYEKKARRAQIWQAVTDGLASIASLVGTMAGGLPTRHVNAEGTRKAYDEVLDRDKRRADEYWERWRQAREADRRDQLDRYNIYLGDEGRRYNQWVFKNYDMPRQKALDEINIQYKKGRLDGMETSRELKEKQIDYWVAKGEITQEQGRRLKAGLPLNPSSGRGGSGGGRGGSGGGGGKNYVAGRSYPTAGDADAAALSYAKGHNIPTTKVVEEEDQYVLKTRRTVNMSKTEIRQIVNDHYAAQNGGGNNSNRGNGGGNRGVNNLRNTAEAAQKMGL